MSGARTVKWCSIEKALVTGDATRLSPVLIPPWRSRQQLTAPSGTGTTASAASWAALRDDRIRAGPHAGRGLASRPRPIAVSNTLFLKSARDLSS